ncbi:MAG TPA: trypsin-like peptidase domain-containing protein [Candidatus Paceibacterota bacterium]
MFCKNCGNEIKQGIKFCTKCGKESLPIQIPIKTKYKILLKNKLKKFHQFLTKKKLIIGWVTLTILVLGAYFIYTKGKHKIPTADQIQKDIASVVVNIYCEGSNGWDDETQISGGSGTIITTDGLVLTNAHIIPQGKDESLYDKSCLVSLPDPTTGASKEIYYARPIVVPDISEKYDLAFLQIDDVYYDEAEDKFYGEYPKVFPAYDDEKYCKAEDVKLGEPVRIYGYPAISGGYALTITDGIVSSLLPKSGYIITSAKISHGNSGGLAVDQYGCRIGVPSMVSGDDYESLGVIISNNLIYDFTEEIRTILNTTDN